jgi:hypothetical protein
MKSARLLLVAITGIIAGCSSQSTTNPVTPFAPPPPAFVLSGTLTLTPLPSCTLVSDRISGSVEYYRTDINPDGSGRLVFDLQCTASDHRFTLTARE